jgi:hypothetical protein
MPRALHRDAVIAIGRTEVNLERHLAIRSSSVENTSDCPQQSEQSCNTAALFLV